MQALARIPIFYQLHQDHRKPSQRDFNIPHPLQTHDTTPQTFPPPHLTLQLPHPLRQLPLPKIPHIHDPLLAQIQLLHVRRILLRWPTDPACDDDGIRLEDDAVVDDFVDGEGDEVVVLDQGAFVGGVPDSLSERGFFPNQQSRL